MYFRVIVKQNGSFLFRTSRISTAAALFPILRGIEAGFTGATSLVASSGTYTIEVLQAKSAEGAVMSFAEVAALEAGLNTPAEVEPEKGSLDPGSCF